MAASSSKGSHARDQAGAEPPLDELLSDPAMMALMRADRVTDGALRVVICSAKRHLEARRTSLSPLASADESPGPHAAAQPAWLLALAILDEDTLLKRGIRRDQIAGLPRLCTAEVPELRRMMARLGLLPDETALPLPVRVDLRLTCTECHERQRCRTWLASANVTEGYQAFCPNSWVFDRTRRLRRWRREELNSRLNAVATTSRHLAAPMSISAML